MSIHSLVLYGSHARGDYRPLSDVDFLAIVSDSEPIAGIWGRVQVRFYTAAYFERMCREGSLFALHIKTEGRVVFDHEGVFKNLVSQFQYKESYEAERLEAGELGWCIAELIDSSHNGKLLVKTMLYSVRTIAFSILAERRMPAFSMTETCNRMKDKNLKRLWEIKYDTMIPKSATHDLQTYLNDHGCPPPTWLGAVREQDGANVKSKSDFVRKRVNQLLVSSSGYASASE